MGVPTTDKYSITEGNDASVEYNLDMRRRPLCHNVSPRIRAMAIDFVCSMLDGALTKPVSIGEIEITPQGASGLGYECCHNKQLALRNHWEECISYSANYHSYPPPCGLICIKEVKHYQS